VSAEFCEPLCDCFRGRNWHLCAFAQEGRHGCGEGCPERPRLGGADESPVELGKDLGGKLVITACLYCHHTMAQTQPGARDPHPARSPTRHGRPADKPRPLARHPAQRITGNRPGRPQPPSQAQIIPFGINSSREGNGQITAHKAAPRAFSLAFSITQRDTACRS
jgi:hypothetical protein